MIDEEGNEIDDDLWADMMEAYAQGFVSGGGGVGGPSEELENEAAYNNMTDEEEQERIQKFLQRIKEDEREKVRELLNDYLNQELVHTDMVDVECCFPTENEIEYLEFESTEAAVEYFSKREKIQNMLVAISNGNEEMRMIEVADILKALENAAVQNFEKMELLYADVCKSPKGYLRLLVQA